MRGRCASCADSRRGRRSRRRGFSNTYDFGNFKGDPSALMVKYFDAFVYVTNWGTRELMLRLPRRALDMSLVASCCAGRSASISPAGRDHVVLTFTREDEEGGDCGRGRGLAILACTGRADRRAGGRRAAAHLAWLRYAQCGELDDDYGEPPPPAGLGQLSAPLARFVEFLGVDPALIKAAAKRSPPQTAMPARELAAWISGLTTKEKDQLLLKLVRGEVTDVGLALRRRFDRERHVVR